MYSVYGNLYYNHMFNWQIINVCNKSLENVLQFWMRICVVDESNFSDVFFQTKFWGKGGAPRQSE